MSMTPVYPSETALNSLSDFDRRGDSRDTGIDPAFLASPVVDAEDWECSDCGAPTAGPEAPCGKCAAPQRALPTDWTCATCGDRRGGVGTRVEGKRIHTCWTCLRRQNLRVETVAGTALRYGKGKCVLVSDLSRWSLDSGPHIATRLEIRLKSGCKIDVTEEPWLSDLCAELGVGAAAVRGEQVGGAR